MTKEEIQKNSEHWYNKYKELENKIADIKANCDLAIEGRDIKIKELEQTNNKFLDVINNQDVKIADLKSENEELRNNGFTVSAMTEQQLKVALEKGEQLEKENAEWEKFVKDIQNRNEENYLKVCHKLATELNRGIELADQLIKAKEIIKNLLFLVIASQIKTIESDEIKEQAKQFLKEIEK